MKLPDSFIDLLESNAELNLFIPNIQRSSQMRFVTCIVRERQLRLYGQVARFPDADPAHQILSAREPREWRRSKGRPRVSWLQQVDQHLKEMGMGQASAWGMARWRPLEYRQKVDTAMHCSGACSHTWPDLIWWEPFSIMSCCERYFPWFYMKLHCLQKLFTLLDFCHILLLQPEFKMG